MKFLLVYVQRGDLFCTNQQRIYRIPKNRIPSYSYYLNDGNLHENPFQIPGEDMAAAAPSFNIIEEDDDDDGYIELEII